MKTKFLATGSSCDDKRINILTAQSCLFEYTYLPLRSACFPRKLILATNSARAYLMTKLSCSSNWIWDWLNIGKFQLHKFWNFNWILCYFFRFCNGSLANKPTKNLQQWEHWQLPTFVVNWKISEDISRKTWDKKEKQFTSNLFYFPTQWILIGMRPFSSRSDFFQDKQIKQAWFLRHLLTFVISFCLWIKRWDWHTGRILCEEENIRRIA